jgi:hypothetical protein
MEGARMIVQGPPATTPDERGITRTDWLLIGLLVAVVLPLRVWLICNTEVTARDSIGYIRYALQFEQYGWKETLLKNHQHPGYPVLVMLMSQPVRAIHGATTPENMELSTQLVNLLASLVLIVPMYLLGRRFFDRPVSFLGTLLYQYLPISAQNLSDGISEPIYLVLMTAALLQAVHAVGDRSAWRCCGCGVFTGLAYLTRPEGALVLPAFMGVLLAMQLWPAWRGSWLQFCKCVLAATTSAVLVGSIYFGTTGKFSNKPTVDVITHEVVVSPLPRGEGPGVRALGHQSSRTTWQTSLPSTHTPGPSPGGRGEKGTHTPGPSPGGRGGKYLFAATVAASDRQTMRLVNSVWAIVAEINQGFHYAAGVAAFLGLLWSLGALRRDAGFWVLAVYSGLHFAVLVKLALVASYVSDRHVTIFVLFGCFFVVIGLRELPRRVLEWLKVSGDLSGWRGWLRSAPVWFGVLFAVLIMCSLPKGAQRLHGNRAGNHEAGRWLAAHIAASDNAHIEDDHAWSHFFSGMVFQEGREPVFPKDHPSKCYVVTTRARDAQANAGRPAPRLAEDARVVYFWPENGGVDKARVVVYVQPRRFEEFGWKTH